NAEVIWKLVYISNVSPHDYSDWYNPRIGDEPANPDQKQELIAALAANNEAFTGYGLSAPSPTLVSGFDPDDTRKDITVIDQYAGIPLNFTYCGKFQGMNQATSPRGNHGEDIVIFRLADVILMLAEAENEQGKINEAAEHIDMIRARAYEPDRPAMVNTGLNEDDVREIIFHERRNELAGEGHRRYDLVRWGKLVETVQNVDYGPHYHPQNNVQPHHILFPLNPDIIEIANKRAGKEVLKQNPGY
ncbi:MAG TPA: RagB/SusD family nutrient uptake outer membrane protein, partial [Anseongella sp.]|nr:RagB/SusD family nutrient uptake outer membrane protein [Anseongella sp.]